LINPIKVNLTFSLSKRGGGKDEDTDLVQFLRGLGFVVVSVQHSPLRLNALSLRHVFGTQDEILQPLKKHYMQQALREGYKVLGSFEFLGNPVGLFHSIGTGVMDFFVEPSRGIVQSPKEFGSGLGKGSQSLVKHTIYGLFNTASKLTGTTARGLATLSMDQDYISERGYMVREHPNNIFEGFVQGGRAVKVGVSHGISGLVTQPIQGAQKEGKLGFVKGLGKGIVGVAAKPTAGVLDLVSKTAEGVRNSTKAEKRINRQRMPRYFPADGTLSVFSPAKSYGQYLLMTTSDLELLKSGVYPKDQDPIKLGCPKGECYHSHVIYNNGTTLMFTNLRIICYADPRGVLKKWEMPYENISKVVEVDEGIRFLLKTPMPKKRGVLGWIKVSYLSVKCKETTSRRFLFERSLAMLEAHASSK